MVSGIRFEWASGSLYVQTFAKDHGVIVDDLEFPIRSPGPLLRLLWY